VGKVKEQRQKQVNQRGIPETIVKIRLKKQHLHTINNKMLV